MALPALAAVTAAIWKRTFDEAAACGLPMCGSISEDGKYVAPPHYKPWTPPRRLPKVPKKAAKFDPPLQCVEPIVFELPDPSADDPLKFLERSEAMEAAMSAIEQLRAAEVAVIQCRYGLCDGIPKSLTLCSEIFGISRERIRQIESRGIRHLRHPSRSHLLRNLLQDWFG